jgi:hypothetical protein
MPWLEQKGVGSYAVNAAKRSSRSASMNMTTLQNAKTAAMRHSIIARFYASRVTRQRQVAELRNGLLSGVVSAGALGSGSRRECLDHEIQNGR